MSVRRTLPQFLPWAVMALLPALVYIMFRSGYLTDAIVRVPREHFHIVTAVAVVGLVLAGITAYAAMRMAIAQVLLVALAFLSLTAAFVVHGLSTPGYLLPDQAEYAAVVIGFAARLGVLMEAVFLAASAVTLPPAVDRALVAQRKWILLAWIALAAAFMAISLINPEAVPPTLVQHRLFIDGSAYLTMALAAIAAVRYARRYLESGLPLFATIAIGATLLFEAQVSMQWSQPWQQSWWLYHIDLLIGLLAMSWGLLDEYARGRGPMHALSHLGEADRVALIRAGYSDVVRAFSASLEARDGYTIGHGERVSALCVLMGEQLRLPSRRLRAMAHGALLHDVGKIGVPDQLLHKPGALTTDEHDRVREHSVRGSTIILAAGGGEVEHAVVRHHHERWDGGGYPDGLAGDAIPLEARIAAVADVYDAVRSARSYREAWTAETAQRLIRDGAGTHFDPACVESFFSVVAVWEARFVDDNTAYVEERTL